MFKFYNGSLIAGNRAEVNGAKYYVKYVISKNVDSPTLLVESI